MEKLRLQEVLLAFVAKCLLGTWPGKRGPQCLGSFLVSLSPRQRPVQGGHRDARVERELSLSSKDPWLTPNSSWSRGAL